MRNYTLVVFRDFHIATFGGLLASSAKFEQWLVAIDIVRNPAV